MKQTLSDLLNAKGRNGDTYQNGIRPGATRLAQFNECAKLSGIPALYAQDGKGKGAIAYLKFFDPCGSWSWFATELEAATGEAFGLVKGFEDELGYFSLNELANVKGKMGIGIELDMHWTPRPLSEC